MKATKSSSLLLFMMVAITTASFVRGQAPTKSRDQRYLRAYDGDDQTGANYEFFENSPDISVQGMGNIINSSHSTGLWILYDETDFVGKTCHLIEFDNYFNWWEGCQNMASSLRYAGSPFGLNDNYFNLYDIDYNRGEELGGNTDMASLGSFDLRTSSFALAGQSEWTLYTGQGYTGASVCVVPTEEKSGLDGTVMNFVWYNHMADIGLPDNSIRSIARGCLSDRVVGAPRSHNAALLRP
jgi:hypothetical protein